jgi:hypothetical protein
LRRLRATGLPVARTTFTASTAAATAAATPPASASRRRTCVSLDGFSLHFDCAKAKLQHCRQDLVDISGRSAKGVRRDDADVHAAEV